MKHDFSKTKSYQNWLNHALKYKIILYLGVNFIHAFIQLFGLKRVNMFTKKILDLLYSDKNHYLTLENTEQLATRTRILMRSIRKSKYLFSNCLSSSFLFWLMLYVQGLETDLVIGCRKDDSMKAHAWVEVEGIALNAGKRVRQNYKVLDYNFSIFNF